MAFSNKLSYFLKKKPYLSNKSWIQFYNNQTKAIKKTNKAYASIWKKYTSFIKWCKNFIFVYQVWIIISRKYVIISKWENQFIENSLHILHRIYPQAQGTLKYVIVAFALMQIQICRRFKPYFLIFLKTILWKNVVP